MRPAFSLGMISFQCVASSFAVKVRLVHNELNLMDTFLSVADNY
jgi:hypothetical protein